MEDYYLKPTNNTPEISGCYYDETITITGNSYPVNVLEVFAPFGKWFEKYIQRKKKMKLIVDTEYLNSASILFMKNIFRQIDKNNISGEFYWLYDHEDLELRELGLEMNETTGIEITVLDKVLFEKKMKPGLF